MAGDMARETTCVTFMDASELWEWNKNGKPPRSEITESSSALGDWRSWMERTIRQQVRKIALPQHTVDRIARLQEPHVAFEEKEWPGMWHRMENRERKWDDCHKNDVMWGMGITDMARKILAAMRTGEREPEGEKGLQPSKHAVTIQRVREWKEDPVQQQPQLHVERRPE